MIAMPTQRRAAASTQEAHGTAGARTGTPLALTPPVLLKDLAEAVLLKLMDFNGENLVGEGRYERLDERAFSLR
jgi:hypothetical protein